MTYQLYSGEKREYLNTGSAISKGGFVVLADRIGIAEDDIAATTGRGSVSVSGVWVLGKTSGVAWTAGCKLYYDSSAGTVTATVATGLYFIGYAFRVEASAATTGAVHLAPFAEEGGRSISLSATGNQELAAADILSGRLFVTVPNTAALTVTLPAIANGPGDARITIYKSTADAYAVTVSGNGAETIVGSTGTMNTQYDRATLVKGPAAYVVESATNYDGLRSGYETDADGTAAVSAADLTNIDQYTVTLSYNGAVALSIPGSDSTNTGKKLIVKKSGTAGAVTITPAAGTIAGGANHALVTNQGDVASFVSDGAGDWVEVTEAYTLTSGYETDATGTATVSAADLLGKAVYAVTCSVAGTGTLAIPGADGTNKGIVLTVKKTGSAGAITITPAAGTIAGGANHTALDAQNDVAMFISDGAGDWLLGPNVIA